MRWEIIEEIESGMGKKTVRERKVDDRESGMRDNERERMCLFISPFVFWQKLIVSPFFKFLINVNFFF